MVSKYLSSAIRGARTMHEGAEESEPNFSGQPDVK